MKINVFSKNVYIKERKKLKSKTGGQEIYDKIFKFLDKYKDQNVFNFEYFKQREKIYLSKEYFGKLVEFHIKTNPLILAINGNQIC